jgi:HPr kinase/phosphorylase
MMPSLVHATCIALAGHGVLLLGPSGAGKSDLALRLISQGAELVSDDQTLLSLEGGRLIATPPPALAGLIEVRGVGILRFAHLGSIALTLAAQLDEADRIERLPEPLIWEFQGIRLPLTRLAPFAASAPEKLRLAVQVATGDIMAVR